MQVILIFFELLKSLLKLNFHRLSEFETFKGLRENIAKDLPLWQEFFNDDSPQTKKMPKEWNNLGDFHKIMILRCFRPDKLVPAIQSFVTGR